MGNIQLPPASRRNPEHDWSWRRGGGIPAPISLWMTHACSMRWKLQQRDVSARSREQLAGVCSYAESPPEPHQAPSGCSFMCIHRNIRLPTDIGAIFLRSLKFEMWWQLHLQWHTAGKFIQRYNCSARRRATKRNEWDKKTKNKNKTALAFLAWTTQLVHTKDEFRESNRIQK